MQTRSQKFAVAISDGYSSQFPPAKTFRAISPDQAARAAVATQSGVAMDKLETRRHAVAGLFMVYPIGDIGSRVLVSVEEVGR